jgi:hypothetical protein
VAGAVLAAVSSPLPWLEKVGNPPPDTLTGWSGLLDGFLIGVAAVVAAVLAASRGAATSQLTTIRWLPTAMGLLAALLCLSTVRDFENQIAIWRIEGATGGVYQPGMFAAFAGVAVLNAGTLALGVRAWRTQPASTQRVSQDGVSTERVRAAWRPTPEVAVGLVCGAAGVLGGAVLVLATIRDPVAISLPLLLAVVTGGLVGANVGARVGARFRQAPRD